MLLVLEIKMQKKEEQLFDGLTCDELLELWANVYPEDIVSSEPKNFFIDLDDDLGPLATADFENS